MSGCVAASHQTSLWLFDQRATPPLLVHLAVPRGRKVRPIEGVCIHVVPVLDASIIDPRQTPRRMRLDIAAIDAAHLCSRVEDALAIIYGVAQRGRVSPVNLQRALSARKRHRHRAALEAILVDATQGTMSGLEREHLHVMLRHQLPAGIRQHKTAGPNGSRYLDVMHSEGLDAPLVTELDGRRGHDLTHERWRDMDRDNLDEELGRGHLRYGPAQVFGEGCRVARQTRRALVRRGWNGQARPCGPGCIVLT